MKKPVSHTEPVTVAAEQGMIGLIPYAAVLVLSALVLFRPWPARNAPRAGVAAAYAGALRAFARLRGVCDRPCDVGAARAGNRLTGR